MMQGESNLPSEISNDTISYFTCYIRTKYTGTVYLQTKKKIKMYYEILFSYFILFFSTIILSLLQSTYINNNQFFKNDSIIILHLNFEF